MDISLTSPKEKLVSEPVKPIFDDGCSDCPVVVGEPLVPQAILWRGTNYPVLRVLSSGKGLGPCTHNSGERYVTKHWYVLETTNHMTMRLYFERRPRSRGARARRWWLYSVEARD